VSAIASIVEISSGSATARRLAGIAASVAVVPLMHALTDFLAHIGQYISSEEVGVRRQKLWSSTVALHIPLFVAFIVGSVGAAKAYEPTDGHGRSDPRLSAASVLFLILLSLLTAFSVAYAIRWRRCGYLEKRLLVSVGVTLPFVYVSVTYVICCAFSLPSETFSPLSRTKRSVAVNAAMTTVPECLVMALFLWAGVYAKLAETNPEKEEQITEAARASRAAKVEAE
jgi:hypothetical protein